MRIFIFLLLGAVTSEKIAIHHWNDISGQIEKYNNYKKGEDFIPESCNNVTTNCIGGIDNLALYLDENVPGVSPAKVFRVTTGNLVGGENGWLSVLGWSKFGSLVDVFYKPDVMTYGIKEFESGLNRTNEYHKEHFNTSITLANVKCPTGSPLPLEKIFCENVTPFTVLKDTSVAVIGFVTPNVAKLSSPGELEFEDVVTSIKKVVGAQGSKYKTYIAVGDGSLDIAKEILDNVPKIQAVIYGRAMGTTKDMSGAGNYPMKYANRWIATAGRYGSTLGQLILDIDDTTGNIRSVAGSQLIEIKNKNQPSTIITQYSADISAANMKKIGTSVFDLEGGERCWREECNLGNLVADSMVHCAYQKFSNVTQPIVAIWQGGSLFRDMIKGREKIGKVDLHRWLPYHNYAHLVKVLGSNLKFVFEESAKGMTANVTDVSDWGQFLQVSSGLTVYYDKKTKPPQLIKILSLHEEEGRPVMKEIEMDKSYFIVIPSFMKEGRSVYGFAKTFWQPIFSSTDIDFDDNCLENYITGLGTVTVGFEERIWTDGYSEPPKTGGTKGQNTAVTVILTIVFMCVILGIIYVGYFYVFPKLTGRHPRGFRNFDE